MVQTQIQKKVLLFFGKYKTVKYKKGELIFQPEDSIQSIYFLSDGYVRMYSIFSDGKELTYNIFKPGSYFPLFLSFVTMENSFFFEPITSVSLIKAPKDDVIRFVEHNSDVLYDFTKRISSGFHGLLTNLQYQLFGPVHRRIPSTIILLSKRFGVQTKDGLHIMLPLTHQDIANLTGVARETASLEMEELQKQKLISYAHKIITIRNLDLLVKEASLNEEVRDTGADI